MDKDFEDLASTLWWASDDCPWSRTPPTPDGKFAVFPRVKRHPPGSKAEKDQARRWEESALRMHDLQLTIIPEPKPVDNELQARKDLRRGD